MRWPPNCSATRRVPRTPPGPDFALTHCIARADAVAEVEAALAAGDPFAVAFIDVRMPPGIDGKETATRIRALDPDINLVIVTGYSDFSPLEISRVAGPADKIFYIAKPFEVAEVVQTATALGQPLADRPRTGRRARRAGAAGRAARGAERSNSPPTKAARSTSPPTIR